MVTVSIPVPSPTRPSGWDPDSIPSEGVSKASYLVSLNLNVLICEMGLTTPSPGGL